MTSLLDARGRPIESPAPPPPEPERSWGARPQRLDTRTFEELEGLALKEDVRLSVGSGPNGEPTRQDFIEALEIHFAHSRAPGAAEGVEMVPCRVVTHMWSQKEGQGVVQYGRGSTCLVPRHRLEYFQRTRTNPPIVPLDAGGG